VTFIRSICREELRAFFGLYRRPHGLLRSSETYRLRGLLNKAFTPHAVEAMRPRIQQLVDGFIDRALPRGAWT